MNECNNKSCKTCKYAEQEIITENLKDNYSNWLCTHDKKKSVISLSVLDSKPLNPPVWCPLHGLTSLGKSDTTKVQEKKKLNNFEKREILEKMKPMIEWDDIKEHEVYHIPPLLYDDRKDIIVLTKNDMYLTYRTLSKELDKSSNITNRLYKNMLTSRFLTQHKVQKIQVIAK